MLNRVREDIFASHGRDRFRGDLQCSERCADAAGELWLRNLQDHLDVLQKFERAERMEILEKREVRMQGNDGLYTKHRYYDPQERATWMEEVLFVNRNDTVYRFELDCRADQIERFAAVFEHLVGTVEFDCAN